MTLSRTMRALGATTLAGGLLLTGTPIASADQVRDGQWANQYFDLEKVWSVSRGDGVKVALIDTGVDGSHPDLTGQVVGNYDPSGQDQATHPTDAHGTNMASMIAGHGHGSGSADGVIGLAPGVKLLSIYKDNASGSAEGEDIRWAVDHGAKIINMSIGGSSEDPAVPDAVAYAASHDVLIIASAGNSGVTPVEYPAKTPGILAVGATDQNHTIWAKSNYGPEVLLSAPGARVVGAGSCNGGQYCIGDGTSGAAAYVSAAAALVRAKFPNLTAGQVANRLVKSAYVPASLQGAKLPDPHYGYGIIRPYEALTQDIPDGSAQGPLAVPAHAGSGQASDAPSPGIGAPGAGSGSTGGPSTVGETNLNTTAVTLAAVVGVLLLVVVIALIVAVSRRRKSAQGMAGQVPYGAQSHGAQQQYGAPSAWPQQPQPPYGNQVPPTGYSPQQSYQNSPYGQGGDHQR
ncbi:S8 family serine peptidase [Kitasatospora sp. NPDC001175]|uniref:S8 family serine peptidase n=1 Tax=Kitasatospora sp. NPDC001175 TaxID=3157103 RepID=UPI003D00FC00